MAQINCWQNPSLAYSGIEGLRSSQKESNFALGDRFETDRPKEMGSLQPSHQMVPVATTETMEMPTQTMLL